jgi:hypothetical protein
MFYRRKQWRILAIVLMNVAVVPVSWTNADEEASAPPRERGKTPTVQLALLLDTSNSMDGLIDQAKTQLWTIVGEFAKTKLAGKSPRLEVALYEYGNDNLPAAEGYVRMVVPMTDDLDKISEALFALTTNGGEEYCGKVIQVATRQLTWSRENGDLRCIFIAGNEPFSQGGVDYRIACKAAADAGITVSTIFCGDREQGIRTNWEHGAQIAEGSYLCINQDHRAVAIATPQDKELVRLSSELNETYLPYGDAETREKYADRQEMQDVNAAKSAVGAVTARAGFKASGLYKNSGWDLVDAIADGNLKLDELKTEQLPETMQPMNLEQRQAHVADMAKRRKEIQARILKLTAARDTYLAKERARLAAEAPDAAAAAAQPLAEAIQEAVESQIGDPP